LPATEGPQSPSIDAALQGGEYRLSSPSLKWLPAAAELRAGRRRCADLRRANIELWAAVQQRAEASVRAARARAVRWLVFSRPPSRGLRAELGELLVRRNHLRARAGFSLGLHDRRCSSRPVRPSFAVGAGTCMSASHAQRGHLPVTPKCGFRSAAWGSHGFRAGPR